MGTANTEFNNPPGFFHIGMTVTEDKILRELYQCGGREVTSQTLCALFHNEECIHNIYGALLVLKEQGLIESDFITPWVWIDNYRNMTVRITAEGRDYVRTHEPVRTEWLRALLSLILAGALLAVMQMLVSVPNLEVIGTAMMAAGIIMMVLRRAGQMLMRKGSWS